MNAKAFRQWCARHEAWLATAGVWFAGLSLTGATIWWSERPATLASDSQLSSETAPSDSTCESASSTTSSNQVADMGMPEPGAVLLPEDTIIGRRASAIRSQAHGGVAQMQKPAS